MQSFISQNQLDPNVFVWYDEQKCLYSTSYLSTPQTRTTKDGRYQLRINSLTHKIHEWSTNDIHNYKNGLTMIYPSDAIRILETLLKKSLQDQIKVVKNKCYFLNEGSEEFDNGFEQRQGFVQALNLSSGTLTLNMETKLTTFYRKNISLLEFVRLQIKSNRLPTNNDYKKLNRMLKNCSIVTQQSNWSDVYEFDRFDHRRPSEISVNETGETLFEYYQNKKKITLTHTGYPCIQVYKRHDYTKPYHLPLELCRFEEWQVYDEPLSEMQEGGKHIPTPEKRYYSITSMLKKCNYDSVSNLLCRAVNFHIDSMEMLELDARVLAQPKINNPAHINKGRIYLNGHLLKPKPISNLAITYFGTDYNDNKRSMGYFSSVLLKMMKDFNINIGNVNCINYSIDQNMGKIDEYFQSVKEQNCEFLICVMNTRHESDLTQLKINIKKCGTIAYGIMTQCAIFSELPKNEKSLKNYCENLIRKINFKNGGINTKVNLDIALKDKKSKTDSFMFIGADVIHPTNVTRQHPSIAAVVSSIDASCSTTAVRVCKQYPKEGKCSIETIIGMAEMVEQLLAFNRATNKVLPNKIIFYRDGVDDGQFKKVLNYEVPAIREAFNKIYGDESNHPSLTFIVVKKRHNTRFFTYNPKSDQLNASHYPKSKKLPRETDNMSIGAVIDTTIVRSDQVNFYLNSHNAPQGVNRPSHYHVLLDDIGFTIDQLQLLTFNLCFTDSRSSAAEAIPSVVHQADIAALKARDLFCNNEDSSTMSFIGRYQQLQNNDLNYEILEVHENLKNRPIFG